MDGFFHKRYDAKQYNCAHFVADVWQKFTGDDISEALAGFLLPVKSRFVRASIRRQFVKLDAPKSPCIVLMQRPKTAPHVGLWVNGKVFHLKETGPEFQPLDVATFGFKSHRFYDVKKCAIS